MLAKAQHEPQEAWFFTGVVMEGERVVGALLDQCAAGCLEVAEDGAAAGLLRGKLGVRPIGILVDGRPPCRLAGRVLDILRKHLLLVLLKQRLTVEAAEEGRGLAAVMALKVGVADVGEVWRPCRCGGPHHGGDNRGIQNEQKKSVLDEICVVVLLFRLA